MALQCSDGASKPILSKFQAERSQISKAGKVFCAGFDGDPDGQHDRGVGPLGERNLSPHAPQDRCGVREAVTAGRGAGGG